MSDQPEMFDDCLNEIRRLGFKIVFRFFIALVAAGLAGEFAALGTITGQHWYYVSVFVNSFAAGWCAFKGVALVRLKQQCENALLSMIQANRDHLEPKP